MDTIDDDEPKSAADCFLEFSSATDCDCDGHDHDADEEGTDEVNPVDAGDTNDATEGSSGLNCNMGQTLRDKQLAWFTRKIDACQVKGKDHEQHKLEGAEEMYASFARLSEDERVRTVSTIIFESSSGSAAHNDVLLKKVGISHPSE